MEDITNHGLGWIRVSTVALLATVVVLLLGVFVLSVQADSSMADFSTDAARVQVVAATLGRNIHGLYLVDRENGAICVYQYVPRERKLKLTAVRRYAFDVRLNAENRKEIQAREP